MSLTVIQQVFHPRLQSWLFFARFNIRGPRQSQSEREALFHRFAAAHHRFHLLLHPLRGVAARYFYSLLHFWMQVFCVVTLAHALS